MHKLVNNFLMTLYEGNLTEGKKVVVISVGKYDFELKCLEIVTNNRSTKIFANSNYSNEKRKVIHILDFFIH